MGADRICEEHSFDNHGITSKKSRKSTLGTKFRNGNRRTLPNIEAHPSITSNYDDQIDVFSGGGYSNLRGACPCVAASRANCFVNDAADGPCASPALSAGTKTVIHFAGGPRNCLFAGERRADVVVT